MKTYKTHSVVGYSISLHHRPVAQAPGARENLFRARRTKGNWKERSRKKTKNYPRCQRSVTPVHISEHLERSGRLERASERRLWRVLGIIGGAKKIAMKTKFRQRSFAFHNTPRRAQIKFSNRDQLRQNQNQNRKSFARFHSKRFSLAHTVIPRTKF